MDVTVVATLSGFNIPLFMKSEGIDPALAGGVILTSATEVIGFASFLGLAKMFLFYLRQTQLGIVSITGLIFKIVTK